jgi:hypothetical protein
MVHEPHAVVATKTYALKKEPAALPEGQRGR